MLYCTSSHHFYQLPSALVVSIMIQIIAVDILNWNKLDIRCDLLFNLYQIIY